MAAVVVVGGGLAGLASAARLARQRHDVVLLDTGTPGRLGEAPDGPGSFTLPAVYRDLFRKTGRPLEPELGLVPVDPARRYVFPDGRVLDLPTGSRAALLDAFGRGLGTAAATEWDSYLAWGGERWDAVRPRLVPPGEATGPDGRPPAVVRVRHPANRLVLDWYAIDAGLDPARAPADLAVLPYLEQAFGAWQVDGGLQTLTAAIAKRALRCGATLEAGKEAAQILARDGKAVGVILASGDAVDADIVVDTIGLQDQGDRQHRASRRGLSRVTVHVRTADATDLPAETVLLGRYDGHGVVVARPDLAADPTAVIVRAIVPTGSASGDETGLVRRLLDAVISAGVVIDGEVVGLSVQPSRPPTQARRWPARPVHGWLDLRDGLADPEVDGLLRAVPRIRGGPAVPWQGLAAALAANWCGTVPRGGAT